MKLLLGLGLFFAVLWFACWLSAWGHDLERPVLWGFAGAWVVIAGLCVLTVSAWLMFGGAR